MIETLIDLIKIHSDGKDESRVCDYIEKRLDCFDCKRVEGEAGRESLIVSIKGERRGALAFIGHIDTVPVPTGDVWKYPPFDGYFDGERVWGRGACDMKGGVSAMIAVAESYKDTLPPRDLKFIFTADEETSGFGIRGVLRDGGFEGVTETVICEPTSLKVGVCEKGALWLSIKAKGVAAHGSAPSLGVNAISKALEVAERVRQRVENGLIDPILYKNTVALTTLNAGTKANMIPDSAVFTLDIRTIPFTKNSEIIEFVSSMEEIEFEILNNRPAISEPLQSPLVKKCKDAGACDVTGLSFYTDGSQYVTETKLPFVILGPGDPALCHKKDEFIHVEELFGAKEIYTKLINS